MVFRDQVLDVDGRLHVARKERRHDEWDQPVEPYGPYGPGVSQRAADDEGDTSPAESDTSPVMSGWAKSRQPRKN